jgi:hypothetical protein
VRAQASRAQSRDPRYNSWPLDLLDSPQAYKYRVP